MRARRRGTHGVAVLCAKVLAAVLAATLGPASTAHADELVVSLSQPGGGYLVTDSKQRIPLELRLSDVRGPLELTKAVVVPGAGRAHDVTIVGPGRVLFNYQPPDKLRTGRDVGEVRVERKDGSSGSFTFSVELGAPRCSQALARAAAGALPGGVGADGVDRRHRAGRERPGGGALARRAVERPGPAPRR
jgi:hypothetical protein